MQIFVNGTLRDVSEDINIATLLNQLKVNTETTIVELNRDIVDKNHYHDTKLAEGDHLELVRFVGGGSWC